MAAHAVGQGPDLGIGNGAAKFFATAAAAWRCSPRSAAPRLKRMPAPLRRPVTYVRPFDRVLIAMRAADACS